MVKDHENEPSLCRDKSNLMVKPSRSANPRNGKDAPHAEVASQPVANA